jgi:DNA-binding transcriptional regulator WhiA
MNRAYIKSIVDSAGWQEIVDFIRNEFNVGLDTDKMSVDEIGKQYLSLQIAKNRLDNAVAKLQAIADQEQRESISYK